MRFDKILKGHWFSLQLLVKDLMLAGAELEKRVDALNDPEPAADEPSVVLEELLATEWFPADQDEHRFCSTCYGLEVKGHHHGCRRAQAIREAGG